MEINLLHSTPLWVASTAIRKCWASEGKSDSYHSLPDGAVFEIPEGYTIDTIVNQEAGDKDKELIHRIGNKNKHSSTLEHLTYSFDIDGISRACLQELARHRMASYSVKSTRYTLKELKEAPVLWYDAPKDCDWKTGYKFIVKTGNEKIDGMAIGALGILQAQLNGGLSNDKAKYMLPEAYKTSLVMTINARSLQNFLELRTSPAALWEIRDLAYAIFDSLPEEHKYLFVDYIYTLKEINDKR